MDIGLKIKNVRIKNGLTQSELADRCELTKGFISQVERNLTSPSISTLMDILESLGTNLKEFFNEKENEKIVIKKEDVFEKQDDELGHTIKWIVPDSQKNKMEPIIIKLEPDGMSLMEEPHDGEEFGYVIAGSIYLQMGDKKYRVKKGESFYFRPSAAHKIINSGKKEAEVLWVSTPPAF